MKNLYLVIFLSAFFIGPVQAQLRPTQAAMGYSVFVKQNVTFFAGTFNSAVAMGGNVILAGRGDVAENSTGSYPFGSNNNDNYAMVVGGRMLLRSGTFGNLKKGEIRIGNTTGVSPIYNDCYNPAQLTNLRIVPFANLSSSSICNDAFNQTPRWELQRKQATLVTASTGLNFDSSFNVLAESSAKLARYVTGAEGTSSFNFANLYYATTWEADNKVNPRLKIVSGTTNVWNVTGADLQALHYLVFETQPSGNTPLVINVNQTGNFTWNAGNFDRLQDSHGAFIIYNFYNNTGTITITGSNTIRGTILAPAATVEDTHNNYIQGQLIANNYVISNDARVNFAQYNAVLPEIAVAPSAPIAAAGINITHMGFTAPWSGQTNVSAYQLDVSRSAAFEAGSMVSGYNNLSVNGVSAAITGLFENTTYYFRVRAVKGSAVSASSNVQIVSTNFNPATTIFRTRNSGKFSATTTWQYNLKKLDYRDTTAHPLFTNKIFVSTGNELAIDINFTVASEATFKMLTGSQVIIEPGVIFTIAGAADFDNQQVTIKSTALGTGSIGKVTGKLNNASNVTVQRYISGLGNRAYRQLGSTVNTTGGSKPFIRDNWQEGTNNPNRTTRNNPVPNYGTQITGSTIGANGFDATQSGNPSMFELNAAATAWSPIANTTSLTFDPKKGYLIFLRGDRSIDLNTNASNGNTTLCTTGSLQIGDQTFTGLKPNEYNFIANPFASAIDWSLVYGLGRNYAAQDYIFYDPNFGTRGGYINVQATDGSNNGGYNLSTSRQIQSGQAFWIKPNGTTLTIAESSKSAVNTRDVFRTNNGTIERLQMLLYFTTTEAQRRIADGIAFKFGVNFLDGVGPEDAVKFNNFDEEVSVLRNGTRLSIEGRPLIALADTLPISMAKMKVQPYEWQFDPTNFDAPGLQAWLHDKFLNTETPISLTEQTLVPFTITSNAASNVGDRFRIVFRSIVVLPINFTNVKAFEKGTQIQVEWNMGTEQNVAQYQIEKSIDGRTFTKAGMQTARTIISTDNYQWLDGQPNNGNNFYRIKAIEKGGTFKYSQVVNVKVGKGNAGISVYPNPVTGSTIGLQFTNQPKGKYAISLYNNLGQQVYQNTFNHIGGSASQTLQLHSQLASGIYQLSVINGENTIIQKVVAP